MNPQTIELPPYGFAELLDVFGSDQRIVAAARLSYDGETKGEEQDKKLLFYLYKNRHTSPFEQANVTFRLKMPVFVMRQFVRHRTFRLNEFSARYTELPDEFFMPEAWRAQATDNKQGSTGEVPYKEELDRAAKEVYDVAIRNYQFLISRGVAKELARVVMPVACYTKIVVNCDLHNLTHFFKLRLHAHAQKEIRDLAQAMFDLVAPKFPWTFQAYRKFTWELKDDDGI